MAEAEPENADVLYLAGRLEPRSEPARALYRRALAVDPQHAHAHYALGYDFLSRGEYRRARPHLAAACERRDNTEFHHLHFLCRLGLEEYDALAAEQEDAVSASPTDFLAMRRLLQVRWLQGQTDALPQRVDAYAAAVTEALDGDPFGIAGVLRWDLAYLREESGELLPLAATLTPPDLRRHFRVAARLCREDLPGAEELLAEGTPADGNTCLLMALAWRLAEGTEQAAAWETRLAEEWNRPGTEMAQGRELLTAAGPVPLARLQEVALVPDQKRTLSALLALKAGPGQGGELAALAERLNVSPLFPHRLVARAVARVRDDGAPAAATQPAAGAGTETDTNAAKERP
jgi:tetratricopeptide (TPR) repeat protein